jgi:hypothetical protein
VLSTTALIGQCSAPDDCPLFDSGKQYFCLFEIINGAGAVVLAAGPGSVVDLTAPVFDHPVVDSINFPDINSVRVQFPVCTDDESGVLGLTYAMQAVNDSTVASFSNMTLIRSVTFPIARFLTGVYYVFTLRCHNRAGVFQRIQSNPIVLRYGAPFAEIFPGMFPAKTNKVYYQSDATSASAWWNIQTYNDIVLVEHGLGSSIGFVNIVPFMPVSPLTQNTFSDLDLYPEIVYYHALRVTSNSTGRSTWFSTTQGFIIDPSPPELGNVTSGTNPSGAVGGVYQCSMSTPAVDLESGITLVQWGVGSTPYFPDVVPWQIVASNATLGKCANTSQCAGFSPGRMFWCFFSVTNGAGLRVQATGNPVVVDTTAPILGQLRRPCDSQGLLSCLYQPASSIQMAWDTPVDDESGIAKIEVCLGLSNNDCNVSAWATLAASASSVVFPVVNRSITTIGRLRVTNGAGMTASFSTPATLLDLSPPLAGAVVDRRCNDLGGVTDGDAADINCVGATWWGFSDPESGLHEYIVSVGTSPGMDDIIMAKSVGLDRSIQWYKNGMFPAGQRAYVMVTAVNRAFMKASASSDGALFTSSSSERVTFST